MVNTMAKKEGVQNITLDTKIIDVSCEVQAVSVDMQLWRVNLVFVTDEDISNLRKCHDQNFKITLKPI
jgi:hypothetical protein